LKKRLSSDIDPWPCLLPAADFIESLAASAELWRLDAFPLPPKKLERLVSSLSDALPFERGRSEDDDVG
jgi:hypothetical protein